MSSQSPPNSQDVILALSQDEALVLFDLLARLVDDRDAVELLPLLEHDAELWALIRVQGLLETRLVQPFLADYRALVDSARDRLVAAHGPWPR